jgi:hypothetical protein
MGKDISVGRAFPSSTLTVFDQAPRLLPLSLADYVANRPALLDGQYDKQLAYALALVSGWSYAEHTTVVRQLARRGIDADVTKIACTNDAMLLVSTAYFVRSKCGRLGVLSFRGTEPANLINWLTDANSTLRPFVYGQVHSGFYSNVEVIWDDISNVLRAAAANEPAASDALPVLPAGAGKYEHPLQSLYITGHSLGAAMAVVAAACLLHEPDGARGWDSILRGVYTYGQPMVGTAEFAVNCDVLFRGRYFRHVYNDDLVPRVPPKTVHNFTHFGQRRYSPSADAPWSDQTREDQAPTLLETLGSAAMSFLIRRVSVPSVVEHLLPLPYSLDDHSPTNYIQVSRSSLSV